MRSARLIVWTLWMMMLYQATGQPLYLYNDEINLADASGEAISQPYTGGFNSTQFMHADMDRDGVEDLVAFDRYGNSVSVFLVRDNRYQHHPEYSYLFPEDVNSWLKLADYNCDDLPDLFTSSPFGIAVYEGIEQNGRLSWQFVTDRVLTRGFTSLVNIQLNANDIPEIMDLDDDGDLDILAFSFTGNGKLNFYRNITLEQSLPCDSLAFETVDRNFGNFSECDCGIVVFGEDCPTGGKTEHVGGNAVLYYDATGDGVRDFFIGQEGCPTFLHMVNNGTNASPQTNNLNVAYPDALQPIRFPGYPFAYIIDADLDGQLDMVATPSSRTNIFNQQEFDRSNWFYRDTDPAPGLQLAFAQNNWLQDQTLDVGEKAYPWFFDLDLDGDLDLLLGNYGSRFEGRFTGRIQLFENTGGPFEPSFQLNQDDYLFVSTLELLNIRPMLGDITGDGAVDLVFMASTFFGATAILYIENEADPPNISFSSETNQLDIEMNLNDVPFLYDVSGDGVADLLIGRTEGNLSYFINNPSNGDPSFSLVSDTQWGIGQSVFRRFLSPALADFELDGNPDLITTDITGEISYYEDIFQQGDTPSSPARELLFAEMDGQIYETRLGSRAVLAPGAIFSDQEPAILVGDVAGGLHMLRNQNELENEDTGEVPIAFQVWPNPVVRSEQLLKIRSNVSGQVVLYNTMGQQLTGSLTLEGRQTEIWPLPDLNAGMYIIRMETVSGQSATRKLMVIK